MSSQRMTFGQYARHVAARDKPPPRMVDIACEIRRTNEAGTMRAIWQGEYDGEVMDRATGEMKPREKWAWLPVSQITINGNGTVTLPEWLARKKGLV